MIVLNGINLVRRCDVCNTPMYEGYCIDGGMAYYCTSDCLYTRMSPEEWEELYDEEGDSYWTEWEEDVELVELILLLEEARNELEDALSFMDTFEDGDTQERAMYKGKIIDRINYFLEKGEV
jgi:hypothetical protein